MKAVTYDYYGHNKEFLVETMAEARYSRYPSDILKVVREEFEKMMEEAGLK